VALSVANHQSYLRTNNLLTVKREMRIVERIREIIAEQLHVEFWNDDRERLLETNLQSMKTAAITPYDVANRLLENYNQ
jgi:putative protein kinase ArgK-like GTPase of G3E family